MSSRVHCLTFGPFSENTYIIQNTKDECVIIDPGCYDQLEEKKFFQLIDKKGVIPVSLLNTHAHIDHIFGNYFVAKKYGLTPQMHVKSKSTFDAAPQAAMLWGLNYTPSPEPDYSLCEGNLELGDELTFEVLFVPGHEPGHIAFVNHKEKYVIGGDVLFKRGIGRTDLPGGNFDELQKSIQEKMYLLPDDYMVYCGHGPTTTIGDEKRENPFIKG